MLCVLLESQLLRGRGTGAEGRQLLNIGMKYLWRSEHCDLGGILKPEELTIFELP